MGNYSSLIDLLSTADKLKFMTVRIDTKERANRNYDNPGPRLTDLIDCFNFYAENHSTLDYKVFYDIMTPHIEKYVISLVKVEAARLSFNKNYGEPEKNVGLSQKSAFNKTDNHIEFLSMLYENNQPLSIELMHQYPLAWAIVDEEWCAWTKIIS